MSFFKAKLPIVGMIHLPPLPGSPRSAHFGGPSGKKNAGSAFAESMTDLEAFVLADTRTLADGGVDAIMIENFGDTPFFPGANPLHVVTLMTRLAIKVREVSGKPIGINVLRNDAMAALAIALASGADFIRVNVLSGARVTDQGVIAGNAHELLRYRRDIGAGHIGIMADVRVKHSMPLGQGGSLAQDVDDLCHRAMADAVVVSGSGTGKAVDMDMLQLTRGAAGDHPVFIGSGATAENLAELAQYASGFIVGTAFKRDGNVAAPVDLQRVARFRQARDALR